MTTFVLLHGGAMGGWVWRYVAARLRADGHDVYTPTFTGFGERVHLLSKDTTHDTHVQDVLGVLTYEDLSDVVLVGHSYAGSVIPGVAAKAGDRIRHAVYVDGMLCQTGESPFEAMSYMSSDQLPGTLAALEAGQTGPGTGIGEQVGAHLKANPYNDMPAELNRWIIEHLSDMPMRCMADPVTVGAETMPASTDYIVAKEDPTMSVSQQRAADLGWRVHEWQSNHALLVSQAGKLSEFLANRA